MRYKYDKGLFDIGIDSIIQSCRNFYGRHLREEAKYLSNFQQAATIHDELLAKEKVLAENAFLIRIGWGSGFDGMTVNYAHKYRKAKRSRRLTEQGLPLGWAEIRI